VLLQMSQIGEKIRVTPADLTGLARRSSTTHVTLAGLSELIKIVTQIGKQIGLVGLAKTTAQISKQIGLARLAKIAARIDKQIGLAGLTGFVGLATQSRKQEVPVRLLTRKAGLWRIQLTRKAGLQKIWLTRKVGLHRIRLTQKTRLCKTRGAGNRKKEMVLLQAKGQLRGGAEGVLPRHKNADCKRCVKESWPGKKKRKSGTIGLTVYGP
jgi:hypothetical protein